VIKTIKELDEDQIKLAITEHLDEAGYTVKEEIELYQDEFAGFCARAVVERKGAHLSHAERDPEEGL
jgi:hypothetical protein